MTVQNDFIETYIEARNRTLAEPEWFTKSMLRINLIPWQLELIEAVLDVYRHSRGMETKFNHDARNKVTVRSGHGPGKTYTLAALLHVWNFCFYGLAVATAPKMDQLTKRLWPRYREIRKGAIESYAASIEVTTTKITFLGDTDWGATAETATDPDKLAGFHDKPQLMLVDEAGASSLDPMFQVIEGALSTDGSVCVEIGNPTRTEGEFFQHHNNETIKHMYYRMHITPEKSGGMVSDKWCKTMEAKYGKDSPIYQVRVLGNFATMAGNIVFHYDFLSELMGTERDTDGSIPDLVVSVDVADGGADSTIITVALHYHSFKRFIKQYSFSFPASDSPILAAEKALEIFDAHYENLVVDVPAFNEKRIVVDAVGVGAGTVGALRKEARDDITIVPHKGGQKTSSKYRNARVQCYFGLYEDLLYKRIVVDADFVDDPEDWNEFCRDLMRITRRDNTDKVDDLITKREYKIKYLCSPDRPDSVSMQYSECDVDIENAGLGDDFGSMGDSVFSEN